MYVIMVYDVAEERVYKVLKTARKYLNWIQNSVLEGEITQGTLLKLKFDIQINTPNTPENYNLIEYLKSFCICKENELDENGSDELNNKLNNESNNELDNELDNKKIGN